MKTNYSHVRLLMLLSALTTLLSGGILIPYTVYIFLFSLGGWPSILIGCNQCCHSLAGSEAVSPKQEENGQFRVKEVEDNVLLVSNRNDCFSILTHRLTKNVPDINFTLRSSTDDCLLLNI